MSAFEDSLKKTLVFEGGYMNDPVDPGGETNYGVTKYTAIAYGYKGDMKTIPMIVVESIYRQLYWDKAKCGELPYALAGIHFDTAVNMGPKTANVILQRAAGVSPDGIIGAITIRAAQRVTIASYVAERIEQYERILKSSPKLGKFRKGWMNRAKSFV